MKKWVQGYACAIVVMLRINGINDPVTDEVFKSGIGTIEEAEAYGVDESDLTELRKYYN